VDKIEETAGLLESVGVTPVQPNVNVAVGIDSSRFLEFFVSRLKGK